MLLNASALPVRPAGAGVYTIELARALATRTDLEVVFAAPSEAVPNVQWLRSPPRGPALRSAWEQLRLPRLMRQEGIDVYHGAHFAVPLRTGVPAVATVHDLAFLRLPRRYSMPRRNYYRALAWTSRRADRIIVPSKAVAADVIHHLGYPPERIRVVSEAPRAGLAPAMEHEIALLCGRVGVERPYLLCLGTAEPGKRAVDAIRALSVMRNEGQAVKLVLAGNEGPLTPLLRREAQALGVLESVVFAGYLLAGDLAALYSGATALVFPSLSEGFGLPPLEAMACGTPVIASSAPALPEVLGTAAIFVPLRDPAGIAHEAIRLLREDSWRSEWTARGREHASRFSWTRAAEESAAVYHELAPR